MPLCTRSEVYIRLVCPGIGLSQGAADDARRQGAGIRLNTQLVVSLLSKGLWLGLILLVRNTYASVLQAASLSFALVLVCLLLWSSLTSPRTRPMKFVIGKGIRGIDVPTEFDLAWTPDPEKNVENLSGVMEMVSGFQPWAVMR